MNITGKELQEEASNIKAGYRNGSVKYVDIDGKKKPFHKNINKSDALREAYVKKNTAIGPRPVKEFDALIKPQMDAYKKMEKNGLIKLHELGPGGATYVYKKAPSSFMRKLSKLSKKFKLK